MYSMAGIVPQFGDTSHISAVPDSKEAFIWLTSKVDVPWSS